MDKRKDFFDNMDSMKNKPIKMLEHDYVEERFVDIFKTIHKDDAQAIYEKEKFNFSKILQENPELKECTPLSLFSVFLDVATKGLTLDNSSKALCYITFRNVRKKKNEGDTWEKRAILDISGYGELVLRERAEQVKYADNPEVIYDGEKYKQENTPEGVFIYHTIEYPRPTDKSIVLIYVRIVRPDGSVTFGTLDQSDILRLKEYSAKNNGKWDKDTGKRVPGEANKLYNDISFLKAKCLKHAFQSFPKLKLNNFSAFTNDEERPEEFGLESANIPKTIEKIKEPQDYQQEPEGIIIEDPDETF